MTCIINSISNNLIICTLNLNYNGNETEDGDEISKYSIRFIKPIEVNDNSKVTFGSSLLTTSSVSEPINLPMRIIIGQNYNNLIGYLNYENVGPHEANKVIEMLPSKYVLTISVTVCVLLIILIVLLFVTFKQRQKKQNKQLKLMQIEFENLESRVANECKEAFAELQMDIGEFANTLNQSGPPFYDFQTYAMKILFPNASENEKNYMTGNIDPRVST